MASPPWRHKSESLFQPERTDRGNQAEAHKRYNNHKWRKLSRPFWFGHKCDKPGCIRLASCCDHIIRVELGGAMYDRRNWQRLCDKCHNSKSSKEARGYSEEWVDTPNGKIPKRHEHLAPDVAGHSYLAKFE